LSDASLLEKFRDKCSELGRTPMLLELEKELKKWILKKYKTYSNFLKVEGFSLPRPEEGLDPKENFRLLASLAALRYHQNDGWSNSEIEVKAFLSEEGLEEGVHYLHNYRLQTPRQRGFYALDFLFLVDPPVVLELDSLWHDIGESEKKDKERDAFLSKLGFKVFRVRSLEQAKEVIEKEVMKGGDCTDRG